MPPDDRVPSWFILIEQFMDQMGGRQPLVTEYIAAGSYNEAVVRARDLAFTFAPQHPMNKRRRSVFQAGDDSWIVVIAGATASYQFRVFVARWLGDAPQ